jgi:N,N'-diacetyllegionaminate synthase
VRTKLCCELGTAHHGDVHVALQMIRAAADAGCDAVKIQHYGPVNPRDPQAVWLHESRLHPNTIRVLRDDAKCKGLEFWATPFDVESLHELIALGVTRIKIASSEACTDWRQGIGHAEMHVVVSWPWGQVRDGVQPHAQRVDLTAIPLYPTPLEAVFRAPLLDGWSDHTIGLSACQYMIAQGAQWIEAHLKLPGITRERDWEKTPEDFRQLRQFAEDVETCKTGVGEVFRNRWSA